MAECVTCAKPLSDVSRFCPYCGTTVEQPPELASAHPMGTAAPQTCATCGAALIPGDAFCGDCGAPAVGGSSPVTATRPSPASQTLAQASASAAGAPAAYAPQAGWAGGQPAQGGAYAPHHAPPSPFSDFLAFRGLFTEANPAAVFWVAVGVDALFWILQFVYYNYGGAKAFTWCLLGFLASVVVIRVMVEIAVMLVRLRREVGGGGRRSR